jgi:hypothetical protein
MRRIMIPDFRPPPPPSRRVQLAALRSAFPGYTFNLLTWEGKPPRFEALSRDGGSPYCLISDDPRELWQELKGTVS